MDDGQQVSELHEQLDGLIEMVTGVGYFLDDNLREQFFEANGVELDTEDERVDLLAMFVIANAVLQRVSEDAELSETLVGANAEKLAWTRNLVREMTQDTLKALVNDPERGTTWSGADDEDLLSFAYATVASTHLNGLVVALDTLADEGLDALSRGPLG
ncbi:MAG: hypothetical protein ACR2J8_06815 [Thermomicrobiales bacterium]